MRAKLRAYSKKNKHQTNGGKPATNRGKPLNKGGYHAGRGEDKNVKANRQTFVMSDGRIGGENAIKTASSWSPGKRKKVK
jgi:hypothetical protein